MQAPVSAAGQRGAATIDPAITRLWIADIAPAREAAWADKHRAWLSPSETARLDRIQRPERRAQFLAGHVLLRRLVAATSNEPVLRVAIVTDADGRPRVESPAGWRASLAHSGRWVAAVIDAANPGAPAPGVDIEAHKTQRDIRTIVRAACGIDAGSVAEAYQVWVQHEAELKSGPGDAEVWVATWDEKAVAICAQARPDPFLIDLDGLVAPRLLDFAWILRARLPAGDGER